MLYPHKFGVGFANATVMKLSLFLVMATSCATGLVASPASWSQEANAPVRILVVHIKPSILAYWLDSVHHPLPAGVTAPPTPLKHPNERFGVPVGINSIEPDDDKSELVATGTPEAITYLTQIARLLDRSSNVSPVQSQLEAPAYLPDPNGVVSPIRAGVLVEFKVQRMQVAPASFDALGILFFGSDTPDSPRLGVISTTKLRGTVATLVAQNKAKVIAAPVATSLDALSGELQKAGTQRATLGIQDENGVFHPFSKGVGIGGLTDPTNFLVQMTQTAKIESGVTEEGAVQVAVTIEPKMQMASGGEQPPTLPAGWGPQSFNSVVKVGKGEIVALVLPKSSKNAPMTTNILLLFPSIVGAATNK